VRKVEKTKDETELTKEQECLKEVTQTLNKYGYEFYPQVVINDKGVHSNLMMRQKIPAQQQLNKGAKDVEAK